MKRAILIAALMLAGCTVPAPGEPCKSCEAMLHTGGTPTGMCSGEFGKYTDVYFCGVISCSSCPMIGRSYDCIPCLRDECASEYAFCVEGAE